MSENKWITVAAAADYLGVTVRTIDRLIDRNKLTATYITPRAKRVSTASIQKLVADNATDKWAA